MRIFIVLSSFLLTFTCFAQPYFGVQTHFGQIYRTDIDSATVLKVLDSVKVAGFTCIRDEMYWSLVETQPGVFSFPPQFDFYAEQARLRGISILLILNYNNPLYAAHAGAGITTDTNRSLYLRYCKAVLQRYIPKGIKLYEVWNEPNLQMFWDPTPSAADYVKLLQKIYQPLKQMDSSITIIAGATSPAEGTALPNIVWTQYLASVFQNGGGNYMDAVSFHLYRVDKSPEQFLEADFSTLQSIAGTQKKVFLSECGYPTNTGWPNLSLQKQAEYVPRLYLLGRKFPMLRQISYYDFRNDGTDPASTEANFGLVYQNMAPKPAFTSMKTLMHTIGGKQLASATIQGSYYKFAFTDAVEKTFALWTNASPSQKPELFAASWLRLQDSPGNLMYIYDADKILDVNYSGAPLYITEMPSPPTLQSVSILRPTDTLTAGSTMQFSFRGIVTGGAPAFIDSGAVIWTVRDSTAAISATGLLTAIKPGTCRITAEFAGKTATATLTILPRYDFLEIEPFNSFDSSQVTLTNMLAETAFTVTDTNFTTAPRALRVNYALKYMSISAHRITFNKHYSMPGEPDTLLLDVFNDGFGHIFNFTFTDADGQDFTINTPSNAITNIRGWKTVKVPLTNFGSAFTFPAKLKRILLYIVRSGAAVDSIYKGAILLDNLRIRGSSPSGTEYVKEKSVPGFWLSQNFPNPFNPSTTIAYSIAGGIHGRGQFVSLKVFDILGKVVAVLVHREQLDGSYTVEFNAEVLPAGAYVYELRAGSRREAKKFLLLK